MTLAARATDAKICLWQIKHRRVQTAAVGLCRGVYVFIGWVAALSFQRIKLRRVQTAAVGLCRGVYVFIGRVAALAFQRFMLRRRQTAAVGLWRGVYVLIARVGALSFLRIMHRRVQTAAVGLWRGVYVFIGRVHPVLRSELYLIIHAEMPLRLFMDFSAGSLCIFNRNITASQEKLYLILRAALSPT